MHRAVLGAEEQQRAGPQHPGLTQEHDDEHLYDWVEWKDPDWRLAGNC